MAQIIQSPNLVFSLTIHLDSKLLHYILYALEIATVLFYYILYSDQHYLKPLFRL